MTELIPAKKPPPWEDERVVLWLMKLWPNNSAKEIARMLSEEFGVVITRNAVIGKLHRLGLTQENSGKRPPVARGPSALRTPKPARKPTLRIVNSSHGYQRIIETITGELPKATCLEGVIPRHVAFADLQTDDCRYPYGDGEVTYCGHTIERTSLCPAHYALCYRAPLPRRVA